MPVKSATQKWQEYEAFMADEVRAAEHRSPSMQTLIVHIEYAASVETVEGAVQDAVERVLDGVRAQAGGDDADFGYRFFGSVKDAGDWEEGLATIEEVGL